MQDLILLLPSIFCYWTSILIVWSVVTAFGIHQIIGKITLCGMSVRSFDEIAFWLALAGAGFLSVLLFGIPQITSMIMDVMIGIDFWYTLFLIYLSGTSLSSWPLVNQLKTPRHDTVDSSVHCNFNPS